jgi:hypothetical protein
VATNGFGFLGLVLDVLGTSFGVIHALKLQKTIPLWPELLRSRAAHQNELVDMLSTQFESTVWEVDSGLPKVHRELILRRKFWISRRYSLDAMLDDKFCDHLSVLRVSTVTTRGLLLLENLRLARVILPLRRPKDDIDDLAENPVIAIGAGISCLLVSVVCFAASSQRQLVWLVCTMISVVFTADMLLSLLKHGTVLFVITCSA